MFVLRWNQMKLRNFTNVKAKHFDSLLLLFVDIVVESDTTFRESIYPSSHLTFFTVGGFSFVWTGH
jgi:hypothetical protein